MHTNNRVWSGVRTSMQPAYITGHSETWDGKGLIAGHNTYYTHSWRTFKDVGNENAWKTIKFGKFGISCCSCIIGVSGRHMDRIASSQPQRDTEFSCKQRIVESCDAYSLHVRLCVSILYSVSMKLIELSDPIDITMYSTYIQYPDEPSGPQPIAER